MNDQETAGGGASPEQETPRWRGFAERLAVRANAAEGGFLSVLRFSALGIAALVLIASVVLLGFGLIQQFGRTHVYPKGVSLAAVDVAPSKAESSSAQPLATPKKIGIDQAVRAKTLAIYRSRFNSYQRPDAKITDQQVVDFVWSKERIDQFEALSNSKLLDKDGKALSTRSEVMLDGLALVDKAAQSDGFKKQLAAYRDAKKVNVCTDEVQSRSRTIDSWDSYSTTCSNWFVSPVGCASTRTVDEPVVVKVCTMKFPQDLEAPAQQLASAVQRYAEVADSKLKSAQFNAEMQTAKNFARKLEGQGNMSTSLKLFLGFLGVMFLYLFIALERHHRSLKDLLVNKK